MRKSATLATSLGVIVLAAAAVAAAATPATALDRYLAGLATLRTQFSQTLTDARGRRLESSAGTLIVLRPGRFRWELRPNSSAAEAAQIMVADGRNVWFYDRELEQVTVRPAAQAITATPAMLLSGSIDVHAAFAISAAGRSQGLEWVLVKPRRSDAEFRDARLGFAGTELRRMILRDKLGQSSAMEFSAQVRNAPVRAEEMSFTPPPGVDVIGKPLS